MRKRVLEYWAPVVIWLVIIFFFSTDTFSSGRTFRLIVPVLLFIFPDLSPQGLEVWHAVIRKLGHISEYFVLAVLAYRALRYEQTDLMRAKVQTVALVAVAALLDEVHQRFTLSRSASIVDVGYDCLGAVSALLLIATYETWRLRSRPIL